jgi:hypothetical protein
MGTTTQSVSVYHSLSGESRDGQYALAHVGGYYSLWQEGDPDKLIAANLTVGELPSELICANCGLPSSEWCPKCIPF